MTLPAPMKLITICADDYAYSPAVSAGIRDLISAGSLDATGAMTTSPHWPEEAKKLIALGSNCKIGLHFDLITPTAPLGKWIFRSLFGKIDPAFIASALEQQIADFEKHMGRLPDFIDSHQHTHTFPQIRTAFLHTLTKVFPDKKIPIRSIHHLISPTQAPIKKQVVLKLSSGYAEEAAGFPTNKAFAGLYSLSPKADFPHLFKQWIETSPSETLIMVHPGRADQNKHDPIAATRPKELEYLLSRQHTDLMARSR